MYLQNLSITDLYIIAQILDTELTQTSNLIVEMHAMKNPMMDEHMENLKTIQSRNQKALMMVRTELYKRMGTIIALANPT